MAAEQETGLSFLFDTAYRYQPDFNRYVSSYIELLKFDNPSMDENQMNIAKQNLQVEFYRLCLESIGIASFDSLLILDYNGILLEINTIAEKTLGIKRKSALGQPFFERIFPDLQIDEYLDWIKEHASDQDEFTRKSTEVLMIKGNGTIFPSEIKVTELKIFGSTLLVLCFNDITRRKWMDQALKYTEERYRKIMGENADAIFLIDPFNKRIEESNPAFNIMMGYNDDELFALRLYDVMDGEPEDIDEWVEKRLRKGTSLLFREQGKFKSRSQHMIDVEYTTSVFDLRNHPILCIITRDSTPREYIVRRSLVDTQIEQMQGNVGKLITRLNELEQTKLTKAQKEILGELQDYGDQLNQTLNHDSKGEKKELPIAEELVPFNLKAAIFHVHNLFKAILKKKKLPLEISIDKDIPDILIGDPLALQEIFFYLLDNAIRLTDEGDILVQVRVTEVQKSIANLLFTIRDAGGGMDPVTKAKISDVLSDDNPLEKGRQYQIRGLAICGHYIKELGGKIRFNTLEGKGTSFVFSLPMETTTKEALDLPEFTLAIAQNHVESLGESMHADKEGAEEELNVFNVPDEPTRADLEEHIQQPEETRVDTATPGRSPDEPLRVLLVEHDMDHAIEIQTHLGRQNVEMRMVDNGRKALEFFQEQDFDLVLMGLDLPIMDGTSAAAAIRSWEQETGRSPVLMLAFDKHDEPPAEEVMQNFNRYVKSPFSPINMIEIRAWALSKLNAGISTMPKSPVEEIAKTASTPEPAAAFPMDPSIDLFADLESEIEAEAAGSTERVVVTLSSDMAKLAPDFLGKRHKDVDKIRQALQEQKLDSIRVLGKSMKGTGAVYGFDQIAEIGKELETAAQEKDLAAAQSSLEQLTDFLQRVEIVME